MVHNKPFSRQLVGRVAAPLLCLLQVSIPHHVSAENIAQPQASSSAPKVGVILGLTGAGAKWSKYQRLGLELAAEELKAEGTPVELYIEDSQTAPSGAVSSFQKLLSLNHVDAVMGDIFALVTEPLIPLSAQNSTLLVTPSMQEQACVPSNPFFFSSASKIPRSKVGWEALFASQSKLKRIALVYFEDPGWGFMYRDVWRTLAKEHGVTVVDEYTSNDYVPDFKSIFPRLLAKNPDGIFIAHEPEGSMKALRQLGYKGVVAYANNVLEVMAGKDSPPAAFDGVYFVDVATSEDFSSRFQKKWGELPILEAHSSYETLRTISKAVRSNPKNPALGMKHVRYEGVAGPLDYSISCAGNGSNWRLMRFTSAGFEEVH
jgi:ABC-type branched-subunit amino acid transport system substrate-binding protein